MTILQCRENLPDRQAAEAVRARIDGKDLLGLELTDPGFDPSVLCEFRARLLDGGAEERLLGKLLEVCQARGLLKARGRQRTDATRVLASVRMMNRLELVGESLRAALNELAAAAPAWRRGAAPHAWYERYARRVEDGRRPRATAEREAYARTVGADGFTLLDRLDAATTPEGLRRLPTVAVLRQVWARHFVREGGASPGGGVRLRAKGDPPPATAPVESPDDPQARFRTRSGTSWTGYVVHLSETCEDDAVHLITHAMTTTATVHEARCTAAIHRALLAKGLAPSEHLVDAADVDAALLVRGRAELGIDLVESMSDPSNSGRKADGTFARGNPFSRGKAKGTRHRTAVVAGPGGGQAVRRRAASLRASSRRPASWPGGVVPAPGLPPRRAAARHDRGTPRPPPPGHRRRTGGGRRPGAPRAPRPPASPPRAPGR